MSDKLGEFINPGTGGQAFPGGGGFDSDAPYYDGMTLRDYFAAQAMPVAAKMWEPRLAAAMGDDEDALAMHELAALAYGIADEMLKRRER